MSLSVAGIWAVDVWDQTVWADGVWQEGAAAPSAVLSGTASSSITEDDLAADDKTSIITLTNGTWLAAGTGAIGSSAQTQSIIDLFSAAESETLGFNNEVTGSLVRTSPTVATITWTSNGHDITAQENISVADIPFALIDGASTDVVVSETFTIDFVAAISAALSGTITAGTKESDIVNGGKTIIITLVNDTWVTAGATFDAQRQNIIDGLSSAQSEATGFNNEVKAKEVVTAVVRTSPTVVTITLTAQAAYDITAQEVISDIIPATALTTSASPIVVVPTFAVNIDSVAGSTPENLTSKLNTNLISPLLSKLIGE